MPSPYKGYTAYFGVKNHEELLTLINKTGDLPRTESFKYRIPDDNSLVPDGFITEEPFFFSPKEWEEVPENLYLALGGST